MSSVENAIKILTVLSKRPYEYGVTELASRIGMGKSGAFKLLAYLVDTGMVVQDENKNYSLGPLTYLLGSAYEKHVGLKSFCNPYLTHMRDVSNENASLAMWVNGEICMVARVESRQLIRVAGSVGSSRPFYASAVGKTLGAFGDPEFIKKKIQQTDFEKFTANTITDPEQLVQELAKIRKQGYAISYEEYALGAVGIGAPLLDASGEAWAAISLGIPTIRVTDQKLQELTALVVDTAREITDRMQGKKE